MGFFSLASAEIVAAGSMTVNKLVFRVPVQFEALSLILTGLLPGEETY